MNILASRLNRIQPSPTIAMSIKARELKAEGKTLNEMIISNADNHFERIHINLAQRGDIVGLNSDICSKANKMKDSGFTLGIMCDGFGRFVVHNGYQDIPREQLEMAWRV